MKEFLKKNIETKSGSVLDVNGNVIGEHDGAILYTIGERVGFKAFKTGSDDKAMYILSKDVSKNTITVTENNLLTGESTENNHGVKVAQLVSVNWNTKKTGDTTNLKARVRYRQEKQDCTFNLSTSQVTFSKAQVLASGQSVVLYSGERCLGGGIIS